jgi:hypothetical protein
MNSGLGPVDAPARRRREPLPAVPEPEQPEPEAAAEPAEEAARPPEVRPAEKIVVSPTPVYEATIVATGVDPLVALKEFDAEVGYLLRALRKG